MRIDADREIPKLLTRSQFAAFIEVSKSYVTKLGNQGRLVLAEDGRVMVPETLALLRSTTAAPERANDAAQTPEYQDWRERKEKAQAEMVEMDVAQRRGQLMDAAEVRAAAVAAVTAIRTRLEMLPDQLAPVLAASSDEQRIRAVLAGEIEAALADMAHAFAKMSNEAQ